MDQDVLGFGVELDGLPIDCLLERMPDQRLVLVVLDTYGVQPLLAPLVRPCQQASHPVLGPLKPFEADHRHCCRLGPGFRNAAQANLWTSSRVTACFLLFVRLLSVKWSHGFGCFLSNSSGCSLRIMRQTLRQSPTTFSPCRSLSPLGPLIILS
jgi:hypothetical protein